MLGRAMKALADVLPLGGPSRLERALVRDVPNLDKPGSFDKQRVFHLPDSRIYEWQRREARWQRFVSEEERVALQNTAEVAKVRLVSPHDGWAEDIPALVPLSELAPGLRLAARIVTDMALLHKANANTAATSAHRILHDHDALLMHSVAKVLREAAVGRQARPDQAATAEAGS